MHRLYRAVIIASLPLVFANVATAGGDAAEGEKVFKRTCATCHITAKEGPKRLGPSLFGVVGRHTGMVEGFRYSAANKNANIVWSAETLEPYLADPKKIIPGTIMAFAGLKKAEDRANVIAYLETLK